jgi:ferredoxin
MKPANDVVHISVDGRTVECPVSENQTVLNAIMKEGLLIRTACGGKGSCHLCRVTVEEGAQLLPEPEAWEVKALGNVLIAQGMRLSCQIKPVQGLVVHLPPFESPEERRERIKKARQRKP